MQQENPFTTMMIELHILLSMLGKTARQSLEQTLAENDFGISGLQYGLLRMLDHEPQTIAELSRKFSLDPSTLVPVVDALEEKGLLARGRDPDDRRRIPLSLTDEGAELIARIPMIGGDDTFRRALEQLGQQKAAQLLALLREYVQHLPQGEEMLASMQARISPYQRCMGLNRKPPTHV